MHIHSSPPAGQAVPTQAAQQAMAARKAASEVRRKLTGFAATTDDEAVHGIASHSQADPDRKQKPQHNDEEFRSVFVSVSA
jgi:hypothetical protein